MASLPSLQEMRKMQASDLTSEVSQLRRSIAKMRMGLMLRSEKNSAEYRRQKKAVAKMLTVLRQKEREAGNDAKTALKAPTKRSKVPAPARRSSAKSEGGSVSAL